MPASGLQQVSWVEQAPQREWRPLTPVSGLQQHLGSCELPDSRLLHKGGGPAQAVHLLLIQGGLLKASPDLQAAACSVLAACCGDCTTRLPSDSFCASCRLDELRGHADQLNKGRHTVLLCHHGVRSAQAAAILQQYHDFTRVSNVEGGIDRFSIEVDSGVPRY